MSINPKTFGRRAVPLAACATLAALGLAAAPAARAQTLFSDNFNTGASPLWGNERGAWTAAGGTYSATAPNNNPLTYTSLPFTLTDFTLNVDINQIQDGGVWLHSDASGNGILLVTGGAGSNDTGLYWHEVHNGNAGAALNVVNNLFTSGVSSPHIRIVVAGNQYSAFVNNAATAATTLTDSTYASGRVGLYDFSPQTFDNVILTAAPEPSPFAALGLGVGGLLWRARKRKANDAAE